MNKKTIREFVTDIEDILGELRHISNIDDKKVRAGILRCNQFTLKEMTEFLIGNKRFINKNLRLYKVREWDDGVGSLPYYDFVFMGDDLPLVSYGCSANYLDIEKVEDNAFMLVDENKVKTYS